VDFQRLRAKPVSSNPYKAFEASHPIGKVGYIVIAANSFERFTLDDFMYPHCLLYGFLLRPVWINLKTAVEQKHKICKACIFWVEP